MIVSLYSFMGPFTFFRIMGYKSCSVLSCKNYTGKKHDISFHMTENPEMRNKWLAANAIGWLDKKKSAVPSVFHG